MAVPKSKKSVSKSKIKRFKKQKINTKQLFLCQICGNTNTTHICYQCTLDIKK